MYLSKECEVQWKKEWGVEILFFYGSINVRGVVVFIKNGFDIDVMLIQIDLSGRFLLFKVLIKEENYIIVNIYGFNKDVEVV